MSTIHAAKGLEWPVVFVPACEEGMPYKSCSRLDIADYNAQALSHFIAASRKTRLTRRGESVGPATKSDADDMSQALAIRRHYARARFLLLEPFSHAHGGW